MPPGRRAHRLPGTGTIRRSNVLQPATHVRARIAHLRAKESRRQEISPLYFFVVCRPAVSSGPTMEARAFWHSPTGALALPWRVHPASASRRRARHRQQLTALTATKTRGTARLPAERERRLFLYNAPFARQLNRALHQTPAPSCLSLDRLRACQLRCQFLSAPKLGERAIMARMPATTYWALVRHGSRNTRPFLWVA